MKVELPRGDRTLLTGLILSWPVPRIAPVREPPKTASDTSPDFIKATKPNAFAVIRMMSCCDGSWPASRLALGAQGDNRYDGLDAVSCFGENHLRALADAVRCSGRPHLREKRSLLTCGGHIDRRRETAIGTKSEKVRFEPSIRISICDPSTADSVSTRLTGKYDGTGCARTAADSARLLPRIKLRRPFQVSSCNSDGTLISKIPPLNGIDRQIIGFTKYLVRNDHVENHWHC